MSVLQHVMLFYHVELATEMGMMIFFGFIHAASRNSWFISKTWLVQVCFKGIGITLGIITKFCI